MSKIENNGISKSPIENQRKSFVASEQQDTSHELQELREQLAARQLREQQLREALKRIADLRNIGKIEPEFVAFEALALPSDTTALEAMIQKAGYVVVTKAKQACIDLGAKGINYSNYTSFVEVIDNLPTVTLNDLK